MDYKAFKMSTSNAHVVHPCGTHR